MPEGFVIPIRILFKLAGASLTSKVSGLQDGLTFPCEPGTIVRRYSSCVIFSIIFFACSFPEFRAIDFL